MFPNTTQVMKDKKSNTGKPNHHPADNRQPVPPHLSTDKLFNGARELIIEHTGEEYRLRITSKGKLILTK